MRKRPFPLPPPPSDLIPESVDQGSLKKKFSGKILFRNNLYHLETGNLSVLEKISNTWFLEELFSYSRTNFDQNLIPALRRIADNRKYTESTRQHASEIIEIIEEHSENKNGRDKVSLAKTEKEKAEIARKMLTDVRYPQTTDILRLLREKSPELKRLALFLIGKFNLTDMIQEVCECLNNPDLVTDAFSVLLSFGKSAGNDLNRFYFISSGNIHLSKVILRIYARNCPGNDTSFLVERLWSNSRQLREITANGLIRCGYKAEKEDRERLKKIIFDTFNMLSRLTSGKVCLEENNNQLLYSEIKDEYQRWKDYLLKLLILTYGNEITISEHENHFGKDEFREKYVPELAGIIFGNSTQTGPENPSGAGTDRKQYRKLQRFFPGEIPEYGELLEDIINADYNSLSIWTKACTLRSIGEIGSENLGESVVALLFSPEEILRQEAARLIARSRSELYRSTSERIPGQIRKRLDEIISGQMDDKELLYGKVLLLASCLGGIRKDELLYLAEMMIFRKGSLDDKAHMDSGEIVWFFTSDEAEAEVEVINGIDKIPDQVKKRAEGSSFYYILPLNAVEEFGFLYPESFFQVLKYIDDKEE